MARRGPYAKTSGTREEILDAALVIIGGSGYTGTTLQEIADAVGMTKPGILHHFGSRDALLTAVLERRDQIDAVRLAGGSASVEDLIQIVRHNATVPGLVALYVALAGIAVTASSDVPSRAFFSRRYVTVESVLCAAVAEVQRAGLIDDARSPRTIARLFIAASDGLQAQWLLDPTIDMAADLEALWSMICRPAPAAREKQLEE